jgi:hypothetical protein
VDEVEMVARVKNLAAVLGRMSGKVGGRELDGLQKCVRLAESVPGLREGLMQVRLVNDAVRCGPGAASRPRTFRPARRRRTRRTSGPRTPVPRLHGVQSSSALPLAAPVLNAV